MKTRKLIAVAFCVAASATTTAFAEDDFGIESASPVTINEPVNPQPGMVANAYKINYQGSGARYKALTSLDVLAKTAALKTVVDKSDSFSRNILPQNCEAHTILWEGYIKCIRTATYTFTMSNRDWYSFYVNGKCYVDQCNGQQSADVELKVGWNKIVVLAYIEYQSNKFEMNYKPKNSLSDPRQIAPKDLFHDQPPEKPW